MAARQPSASFADRDASRSHGSIMTDRDEGTDSQRLAQVWNIDGPVSPGRFAARSHRIRQTHRVGDNLNPLRVPYRAGLGAASTHDSWLRSHQGRRRS